MNLYKTKFIDDILNYKKLKVTYCSDFFSNDEIVKELLNNIDKIKIIKQDNNIIAGTINLEKGIDKLIFIKKYHYKNPINYTFRYFFRNKAKILFNSHYILYPKKINIAKPLMYFNLNQTNEFVFITEFFENSNNLGILYKTLNGKISEDLSKEISFTIANMHLNNVIHGDLKWSNLLISDDNKCLLIDLDQVKIFKNININGIIRDLKRFYRFAFEIDGLKWVDESFINFYMSKLDKNIKNKINLNEVKNKAYKQWCSKGKLKH